LYCSYPAHLLSVVNRRWSIWSTISCPADPSNGALLVDCNSTSANIWKPTGSYTACRSYKQYTGNWIVVFCTFTYKFTYNLQWVTWYASVFMALLCAM